MGDDPPVAFPPVGGCRVRQLVLKISGLESRCVGAKTCNQLTQSGGMNLKKTTLLWMSAVHNAFIPGIDMVTWRLPMMYAFDWITRTELG